jgi:hypothetical protein
MLQKKTVFVLGAGASVAAGVPVMARFLDVAHDLRRGNLPVQFHEDYDAVFDGIRALERVHVKSYLDLHNIESVFAAFEMGKLLGHIGELSDEQIAQAPVQMKRLILSVIEQTTTFGWNQFPIPVSPPYGPFIGLLGYLQSQGILSTVLTFNYDLAFDYALAQHNRDVPTKAINLTLLKLHGSLDWRQCKKCGEIIACDLSTLSNRANVNNYWKPVTTGTSGNYSRLHLLDNFPSVEHCGQPLESEPLIVPPTWSKTQHYQSIADVWRRAAKELSEAENIFICSYSLPETDMFFRYLFALGSVGPGRVRRFWVFNPDSTVKARFEGLAGAELKSRFEFHATTFADAVQKMHAAGT